MSSVVNKAEKFYSIAARQFTLRVEDHPAGTMLTQLTDAQGAEYLRRPNLLWKIEMIDRDHTVAELDMAGCKPVVRQGNDKVHFRWSDVPIGKTTERVTVKLTLVLDDVSATVAWRLAVEDVSNDWSTFRVHIPRLDLAVERGNANDAVILPDDHGVIYRDPLATMPTGGINEKLRRRPYPHGSYAMQLFILQRQDQFLYLAAHDPNAHLKVFFAGPDAENELVYFQPYFDTEIQYGDDWTQPFDWVMTLQRGDWFDAAQIYRKFAQTASWTSRGTLASGKKTPLWYRQIGLVTLRLMRGPGYEDADILAERAFVGVPMVCHYYMWHQSAFDSNYPLMFPEVPDFRKTLRALESNGVHVMPYMNIFSADMHTPLWKEGLSTSATHINPQGDRSLHTWSQNRTMATLCPGAEMTRQMTVMQGARMFEMGASAIYFDEIGMSATWPCHNPKHDHPLGGGATYVTRTNESLALLRQDARLAKPELVLTTEGCAEPYMREMDAFLTGNGLRANAVPLFSAVYHEHVMMFGRYTFTPELTDERFAGAIETKHAQQFCWGAQFGWSRIPLATILQKAPETAGFIRHLAHTWKHNYSFIAEGRMLRELDLSDQLQPIQQRWATSWTDDDGTLMPLMPVMNSVWQRVDGSIAVVLVNVTTAPIALKVRLPGTQDRYAQAMANGIPAEVDAATRSRTYPLPQRAAAELRVVKGDQLHVTTAKGDSEAGFAVTIEPMSAIVLALGSEKHYGTGRVPEV